MAVSADGRYLYAANIFSGTLSIIDTTAGETIATIPVGDGPDGMVLVRRE
jgi:YVTN family beta-propeller protein